MRRTSLPGINEMQLEMEIDELGARVLNEIKRKTGLHDYKEIFNNSVTLLDWAINQRADGKVVAAVDKVHQTYKELQMPVLEHARRSRKMR
jgi:hypothetical protein